MNNILSIKEAKKGATVKDNREKPYCDHKGAILVDEHFRILECEKCEKKIDPFDFVLKVARDNDFWWNKKKDFKEQAMEVHERLEDLKRRERNAKSRLRRAEEKLNQKTG